MRRAAVAGKALADEGLVHHPEHRRALVQQRDQRAPDRKSGDEGFGAVDRIQHPDIFGVLALVAEFLADDAVLGEICLDQPPHHRFRGAIGFGDRIEIVAVLLLSIESEVRKNGRMVSPEEVARRPMKAVKSMTVTAIPWHAGWEISGYCLSQSGRSRTAFYPRIDAGILHAANQRANRGAFSVTKSITKFASSSEID